MIRTEDLTEHDKTNLFKNRDFEEETWHYIEIKGIKKDYYLFSSTGRCYDFVSKSFRKYYCSKGNKNCYWYLKDNIDNCSYSIVNVSSVLAQIYNNDSKKEEINNLISAYSARATLNDKLMNHMREKISKLKQEIDNLTELINNEQNDKNESVALINAIKIASNQAKDVKEQKSNIYCSVKSYLRNVNFKLKHSDLIQIGKMASKYCRDYHLEIKKDCDNYNRYPIEALDIVWWEYKKRFED